MEMGSDDGVPLALRRTPVVEFMMRRTFVVSPTPLSRGKYENVMLLMICSVPYRTGTVRYGNYASCGVSFVGGFGFFFGRDPTSPRCAPSRAH